MMDDGIIQPSGGDIDRIEITPETLQRWADGEVSEAEARVLPAIVIDLNTAREALLENVIYSILIFNEFADIVRRDGVTPAQTASLSRRVEAHLKDRYADILGDAELTQDQIDSVRENIRSFFLRKEPKP